MPFTLCSPVKPSASCEWETRQIGHMTGSANWRRQRWAVEIGWRAWTNLLQICGRWSAHRWTQEGGGIRQICRFPDGGHERAWRCQVATSRCKARLADPVITFGKFAEGQSRAPPEGKSCQLARFRWWSAANGARGSTRDANLHIGDCFRNSAHGRNLSGWPPSANLRNGVQARCRLGGCAKLRILDLLASG